jgi:hypothetical protein
MQLNKDKLFECGNGVYREEKSNGQRRYYLETTCATCSGVFFTDLYKPSKYDKQSCAGPRRGRPFNYKVSDNEKERIATTMTGKTRPDKVKEAISKGLLEGRVPVLDPTKVRPGNPTFRNQGSEHPSFRHGGTGTALYEIHADMVQRCYNKHDHKYHLYGAKGIDICDEWTRYEVFAEWAMSKGWKRELDIHRIDPTKGYSPDNCEFLTRSNHTKKHWEIRRKENEQGTGITKDL